MRMRMGLPAARPLSARRRSRSLLKSAEDGRSADSISAPLWWLDAMRRPINPRPAIAIATASPRAANLANCIPSLDPHAQGRASVPATSVVMQVPLDRRPPRLRKPTIDPNRRDFLALLHQL